MLYAKGAALRWKRKTTTWHIASVPVALSVYSLISIWSTLLPEIQLKWLLLYWMSKVQGTFLPKMHETSMTIVHLWCLKPHWFVGQGRRLSSAFTAQWCPRSWMWLQTASLCDELRSVCVWSPSNNVSNVCNDPQVLRPRKPWLGSKCWLGNKKRTTSGRVFFFGQGGGAPQVCLWPAAGMDGWERSWSVLISQTAGLSWSLKLICPDLSKKILL